MTLPRYPDYKDSGVPWLGEVPGHWDSRRTKYLFDLMARDVAEDDGIVTAFRDGEVTLRANRRTDGFTNALKEVGYQGVRKGDLVIHAMDAFAGAIGVADSDGKSTPVYSVCKPKNSTSNAHYYAHVLRHMALGGFINSLAKGVRERSTDFRWADAGSLYLPLPPIDEQDAIVCFLDRETAKIDALIAEQETLLALLAEKRQATISHAVTRGLNPNVAMKDSGVTWLGEVPAHWEVAPLRWYARISSGDAIASADLSHEPDENRSILAIGGNGLMGFTDRSNIDSPVIAVGRVGALCGNVHSVDAPAWISDNALSLKASNTFHRQYLVAALKARNLNEIASKTAQPLVTGTQVLDQRIPLPSIDEQQRIVEFLDTETAKLDALKAEAQRGIELLKERRNALIAAAVTGKIDVRNAA